MFEARNKQTDMHNKEGKVEHNHERPKHSSNPPFAVVHSHQTVVCGNVTEEPEEPVA